MQKTKSNETLMRLSNIQAVKRTHNLVTRFKEDWVVYPETEEAPYNFIITEWEVQEVEPNPR